MPDVFGRIAFLHRSAPEESLPRTGAIPRRPGELRLIENLVPRLSTRRVPKAIGKGLPRTHSIDSNNPVQKHLTHTTTEGGKQEADGK